MTVLAAVFLLSCVATAAHLALAGSNGCQAVEFSARSCGPTTSVDIGLGLPGLAVSLDSSPAPLAWITITLPPLALSQHQIAPLVPRSPPSLPA